MIIMFEWQLRIPFVIGVLLITAVVHHQVAEKTYPFIQHLMFEIMLHQVVHLQYLSYRRLYVQHHKQQDSGDAS